MIDKVEYILAKFPGKSFNAAGKLHAKCPFHDDSSPSFSITTDGIFICGSVRCGVRGNFSQFYKLCENISWAQVKADLGTSAPVDNLDVTKLFQDRERKTSEDKVNSYPANVEYIGSLDYFKSRRFTDEETAWLAQRFGLRYGVSGTHEGVRLEGSIVVPVYDLDQNYRTFQVRYLDPEAKRRWNNPVNSPIQDLLYGGWLVSGTQKHVWIVEGASDVWNLARFGFEAVGLFTKDASIQQKQALYTLATKYDLTYLVCLDGDAHSHFDPYGKDLCLKLHSELVSLGLDSTIVYLDKQDDPGILPRETVDQLYLEATHAELS